MQRGGLRVVGLVGLRALQGSGNWTIKLEAKIRWSHGDVSDRQAKQLSHLKALTLSRAKGPGLEPQILDPKTKSTEAFHPDS